MNSIGMSGPQELATCSSASGVRWASRVVVVDHVEVAEQLHERA